MKLYHIYKVTFCFSLFGLIGLMPAEGIAQKKRKDESPVASVRLREAEFYFTEGEKHFILEDYAKALIYYQKSLEINPENATVYYKVAEVLSQSEKREDLLKASVNMQQALSLEKKNKYFYLLAAELYANLSQYDKAAETYETMFSELPESQEYLYELAALYQYSNKKDEAIKTYSRAESFLGISEISSLQKNPALF